MNLNKREKEKRQIRYSDAKKIAEQGDKVRSRTWQLPGNFEEYKLENGKHVVDVVPYVVGKGNPKADEGMVHYERRYYIHSNVGPNQEKVICPAQTFGDSCPICEEMARQTRRGVDWEKRKWMRPQMRQLWNLRSKEDGIIRVFEQAYYRGLGEMIDDQINSDEQEDGKEELSNFFKLENGKSLKLFAKEENFKGFTYAKLVQVDFIERKEPLSEDILDEVCCLDDCLVCQSYDQIKKLFGQGESPDEVVEPENTSDTTSSNHFDEDNDTQSSNNSEFKVGDVVDYEGTRCTVTKIQEDSLTLKDSEGGFHKWVEFSDVEKVDSDEEVPETSQR